MATERAKISKMDFSQFRQTLEVVPPFQIQGIVTRLVGIGLEAALPDPVQGQIVEVERAHKKPLTCEVIGFERGKVILLPYGELEGVLSRRARQDNFHRTSNKCGRF